MLWRRFAILLLALAAPAPAQCTALPGTGCAATAPACQTAPQVNTTLGLFFQPLCGTREANWILLGACLGVPFALTPPVACASPSCTVVTDAVVVVRNFSLAVPIPNDPGLVGLSVCTQGLSLCTGSTGPCVTLTQGLLVTILR